MLEKLPSPSSPLLENENFINSRDNEKSPPRKKIKNEGFIKAIGIAKKNLSPIKQKMYNIHRNINSKSVLSKIPFDTGINKPVLESLKLKVNKMHDIDKHCTLIFDEISLSSGLHYDAKNEKLIGYQDLGHIGRNIAKANHALVFMIRGMRKPWKQVLSYYFTSNTISTQNLKELVVYTIKELQNIGLKVVSTVCDQGPTNRSAMSQLCSESDNEKNSCYFNVNNQSVAVIYDVPHLLKSTRNALQKCEIEFEPGKFAKFEYVKRAFKLDKEKKFPILTKLKPEHFNFRDSFSKMKVGVAPATLSNSMASSIESFVASEKISSGSYPYSRIYFQY